MSLSAVSPVAGAPQTRQRRSSVLHIVAQAWRSLTWRHWLIAVGIGVLVGVFYAVFNFLYSFRGMMQVTGGAFPIVPLFTILTRWIVLMTGVACALTLGLAILREKARRTAVRPRDVALTILAVAAFGSLVADPMSFVVQFLERSWLHVPLKTLIDGVDWWTGLSRMYAMSGEKVFTVAGTVTMAAVYYFKDSRTSDALSIAQLGLSRAQKRRLTEELRSAQAMLDPEFLFATLADVDRRFGGDPHVAQRLLDALIRYLRAALPAKDDTIGTLGQQAMLVRAYLDIEAVRSGGQVQGVIEVPVELENRLFAPALVLPLVALVCGDAVGSGRDAEILVKASVAGGRLTIELRGNAALARSPAEAEAVLAPLRERLAALYGSRAELSFAARTPRGTTAKIVIDDPGHASS